MIKIQYVEAALATSVLCAMLPASVLPGAAYL
jgi:hypothetical protein